jgi:hypothetical protein
VRAYIVDVFAETAFSGKPAGVVLLSGPADVGFAGHAVTVFSGRLHTSPHT